MYPRNARAVKNHARGRGGILYFRTPVFNPAKNLAGVYDYLTASTSPSSLARLPT